MKLVQLSLLLAFISLLLVAPAHCQISRHQQPVIRHSSASTLPDTIAITGKIVVVSYGYCGYICLGGTVKIELAQPIAGYNNRYAFVVTACLSKPDTSRIVSVKASKLKQQEKACYYRNISNGINSQAVPFYKLSERETHRLERNEANSK